MILGTVVGVVQTNVKRMLAYSSIAHAGYLLLGIVAANTPARPPSSSICWRTRSRTSARSASSRCSARRSTSTTSCAISPACGSRGRAWPALMTVFLLSLGGFPPTAGFIGKWYIFTAAVQEGHYWLAIIGVLTSVVSVFFYLRIVVMMYMTEGPDTVRPRVPAAAMAGLALATLAVFYLGVLPARVLDLALESISTIF